MAQNQTGVDTTGGDAHGGCHDTMVEMDGPAPGPRLLRAFNRFTLLDKPHLARVFEDVRSFENSLVLSAFIARSFGPSYRDGKLRSLLEAATGLSLTVQGMIDVGARNYLLMRLHSIRAGLDPKSDRLPSRFSEPLPDEASAEHCIEPAQIAAAVSAYYQERGYDQAGVLRPDVLASLGLSEFLEDARTMQW